MARTVFWTTLCGLGHVASSVLLAVSGVVFGFGLERVRFIEEFRGNLAAWAMIAFGLVYLAWGLNKAVRHPHHAHALQLTGVTTQRPAQGLAQMNCQNLPPGNAIGKTQPRNFHFR